MVLFVCLVLLLSSENGFAQLDLGKRYATVPLYQCRPPDYYHCQDTVNCIHASYQCDGQVDCPDLGDDEEGCEDVECAEGSVKCSDTGQCIPQDRVCDGCLDCPQGDDEKDCTSQDHQTCTGNQYFCESDDVCMPVAWVCDGVTGQCGGDSDENCEVSELEEIYLTPESPNATISVSLTKPADTTETESPILVKTWKVVATAGYYLYASPVSISLGETCGPSTVEISEQDVKAAVLCGNSFPPWKGGGIFAHSTDNAVFDVRLMFFNDFGDQDTAGFNLQFSQVSP